MAPFPFLAVLILVWALLIDAVGLHYISHSTAQACLPGDVDCELQRSEELGNGVFLMALVDNT